MTRVTIACPQAHISDANQLAMVLGYGPADGETYGSPAWQDADGNLYACASLPVGDSFVSTATSPLERPEWDTEPYAINMAGATRAQAALVFWVPSEETPDAPQASTADITAIGGVDGLEALSAMGLTQVPEDVA